MLFFVVLSVILASAFADPDQCRVVGGCGIDTDSTDFKYQVSLRYGISFLRSHSCGGIILSNKYVLTAGHCITEVPLYGFLNYVVRAGVIDRGDKSGQDLSVEKTIVHPDYKGGVAVNDLALLKVKGEFIFNEHVGPIALPPADFEPSGVANLTGWGAYNNNPLFPKMPKNLQFLEMPLHSGQECENALMALSGVSEPFDEKANICAGDLSAEGYSACSGDSGGPLAQNGMIIGIVSWGMMPCGTMGAPSVFTRVNTYIDFILANLKQ